MGGGKITVAQEFIYPIDYELAELQPAANALGGLGGGGGGSGTVLQAVKANFGNVSPDDEEDGFREVGVVLTVLPTVEKYNSINLKLNPKVTEFDGFIEYGGYNTVIGAGGSGPPPTIIQPSGQIMPIFSVRKVQTEVSIFDGATVIIGGH